MDDLNKAWVWCSKLDDSKTSFSGYDRLVPEHLYKHMLLEHAIRNNLKFLHHDVPSRKLEVDFEELKEYFKKNQYSEVYNYIGFNKIVLMFAKQSASLVVIETSNTKEAGTYIDIYGVSYEETNKIKEYLLSITSPPSQQKGSIHALMKDCDGVRISFIGLQGASLQRQNYSDNVNKEYDYICEQLGSKDPNGRLTILLGEPGTGKTYFIRGLFNDLCDECSFVVIPPELISAISGPDLLPTLTDFKEEVGDKSIVFILEDAEKCLLPRKGGNEHNAVSSILNLTDGFFGSLLDVKVVATTNERIESLDKALTRNRRLCTSVNFNRLNYEHSVKIMKELNPNVIPYLAEKEYTIAELYDYAKEGKITKKIKEENQKVKLGF